MCGRFVQKGTPEELDEIVDQSEIGDELLLNSYNVAPSQNVPVIANSKLVLMKWGLVPHWAKDLEKITPQINARSETAATKPFFRDAFKKTRCVVPARGFYEWKKMEDKKQPFYIKLRNDSMFFFAGLYSENPLSGNTFTLLTCSPNELVADVHNRMPVIFEKERALHWMRSMNTPLEPFDSERMELYPVSKFVNSPKNDSKRCIQELSVT